MKEYIKNHLGVISIITALLGLFSMFSALSKILDPNINLFLKFVHLRFLDSSFFHIRYLKSFHQLNLLEFSFLLTLLIGGILYITSKQKKVKLLKFSFAIIILNLAVYVLSVTSSLIIYHSSPLGFTEIPRHFLILDICMKIILFYITYQILQVLQQNTSFEKQEKTVDGKTIQILVPANNWKRFFHFSVDMIVSISIFSITILTLGPNLFRKTMEFLQHGYGVSAVLVIYQLFYYTFFETIFGTTPAKFLTGTKVAKLDGSQPTLKTIIFRTLYRFIPFEPFTFIGKNPHKWHDKFTSTSVFEEK